ncbi:unnamed protein product [Cladocopium goreaui]|uniref:BRCT domain-containing protein n=1 Tax=Cladocopium goreaui TaxID=2562237 RepID=A0A9P1CKF5_9DINO|nr:unnamed protein product [Cladocopium goreaui]
MSLGGPGVDGGIDAASVEFFGQKLREAQRKFYEDAPGSAPKRSHRTQAQQVQTLPGAVGEGYSSPSAVERARTSISSAQELLQSKQQGYAAATTETEMSPKEKQRYGPERFFYDQRSYTGVHRNGPPTVVEKDQVSQIVRDAAHGTSPATPVSARKRATSFVSFRSRSSSASSSARRHTLGLGHESETPGSERSPRYGPERFFYDQQTYTGSHRLGGPSTADGAKDLSQMVRRDSEASPRSARSPRGSMVSQSGELPFGRANSMSRASFASLRSLRSEDPRSTAMASRASRVSIASMASTQGDEVSPRRKTETPQSARSSKANLEDFRYGPERFFYDSRTYTGVHKHGGPTCVDIKEPPAQVESQVGGESLRSPRSPTRSRAWSTMSSRSNMLDA